MSKPLLLKLGARLGDAPLENETQSAPEERPHPLLAHPLLAQPQVLAQPQPAPAPAAPAPLAPAPAPIAPAPAVDTKTLLETYEALRRHEETMRDLIVEIRLMYHNLSDKEKLRLEARRDQTTREVRETFAPKLQALDQTIAKLRGSSPS